MPRKPEPPKPIEISGNWYIRYRFAGVRRMHALTDDKGNRITTQRAAKVEAARMWALIQDGQEPTPLQASVSSFVAEYLQAIRNAPRTKAEKAKVLGYFTRWAAGKVTGVREITDRHARTYLDSLSGGPRWFNLTRTYLSGAWAWGMQSGRVAGNPWAAIEPRTVPQKPKPTIAPATWDRFLAKALPHYKLMFQLHHYTGMRPGEICALKWQDVFLAANYLNVHTRKGNKFRAVPLSQELAQELTRLGAWLVIYQAITGRGAINGTVFQTQRGTPFDPLTYWHAVTRTCDAANVPRFNPHMFRHTAATETLRASGDLAAVRDLMGHHSISVTNIYAHSNPESVRRAVALRDKIRDKRRKSS